MHVFHKLNDVLASKDLSGELGVVDGAAMCLAFNRLPTKDMDAIFKPSSVIKKIARDLANTEGLPSQWLNDAVKGFLSKDFKRETFLELSHLRVWIPEAQYMLAMKCISARCDMSDQDDIVFLIKYLKIAKANDVFKLIESYYPANRVQPKTKFLIEELLKKPTKRKKRVEI
ncbi:MAG: hypothetical protein JWQ35_167 [Bacteriovoracaceae bacterium]|nr:hypothetical protein [Bacteriovoracaceae bacterium]